MITSEHIFPDLTTTDPKWKAKAQTLAEEERPFAIHDLNITDHAFVIELARQYCSPEHFKIENGRAEMRPKE